MAGKQGNRLTIQEIVRVQQLLAETELTPQEIAFRMGMSPSSVLSINRRSQIRHYNGKRSRWEKGSQPRLELAAPHL